VGLKISKGARALIRTNYRLHLALAVSIFLVACQQSTSDRLADGGDIPNSLLRLPVVGILQDGRVPVLVKATHVGRARVEFRKIDDAKVRFSQWAELIKDNDYTVNLYLIDIAESQEYQYRVELSGGGYSEWYRFNSFPGVGKPGKFSFVFSACLREKYLEYDVFSEIKALAPTFVALTGDQMYADYDGNLNLLEEYLSNDELRQTMLSEGELILGEDNVLDAFRSKYARVFGTAYQNLSSHVPMLAMWDDHDYGEDNSDGSYPYKQQARKAFTENFPASPYVEPDEGLYYRFTIADVDVFVLDTRWYRAPMQAEDREDKHLLGKKQFSWLVDGLKTSTSSIKIVFSSVSLNDYGGDTSSDRSGFDSWIGYKHERNRLLSLIKSNNIEGVLFFSGDQHYPSAHILNQGESLKPLAHSENFVEYGGETLGTAVFDFSASPLSYKKATGAELDPANQENTDFSYEVFRPGWAHPRPTEKQDATIVIGSVYGVATIDTTTSPATASVKFFELNKVNLAFEEIFHIKVNVSGHSN
jgi:phosphodiesterase/alkaline phosphatase D-like protein